MAAASVACGGAGSGGSPGTGGGGFGGTAATTSGGSGGMATGGAGTGGVAPGGTGGTGGTGETAGTGGTTATGPLIDPACTDGKYSEALPNLSGDTSGVPFNSSALNDFYLGVLGIRYPIGGSMVSGGLKNTSLGQSCVELFAGSPTSAGAAIDSIGTVVHECGHLYDSDLGQFGNNVYVINDSLSFACVKGDSVDRGGDTFARNLLNTDEYSALRPPCGGGFGMGCDSYADIYLDGDPNNGTFESGDQGYNMLLEEAVQYVNSLASSWAFVDRLSSGQSVSDRDGILTFLWYLERYLRMARLQYPAAYQRISGDACWRDATLTVWGRGWLYLEQTKTVGQLGIDAAAIEALVTDPALVEEIQRLRQASGCGS